MYKWSVTGLKENWKTGRQETKTVTVKAGSKEEAIKKGLDKIGTKTLVKCSLV